jgi:peptide/nickel transport system permease protein
VLVVNFFLFRVLPGDPARTLGRGRFKTRSSSRRSARSYGLDQPLPQQFLTYLHNTVTGDLGISLRYRVPVSQLIEDRMWPTLLLVGTSTILAMVIGVWIGIIGAWNRGGKFDKSSTGATLTLYSMPEWWLGLLLIAVFAVGLGRSRGLPHRRAALDRRGPEQPEGRGRHGLATSCCRW